MLTTLAIAMTMTAEPTLVELFSSEGCSSCPPAEALLRAQAASNPSLLVLEFHVDYWNSLGWKDPFSAAEFSERQSRYAQWRGSDQIYTPQAIVDGQDAFVGSSPQKLAAALGRANETKKPALVVEAKGDALGISLTDAPAGELWVAVTEAGLETKVRRGENEGKTLRHAPVVRLVQNLGPHAGGSLARHVPLRFDPSWHRENLRIVAALQDPRTGRIVALGSSSPAGSP